MASSVITIAEAAEDLATTPARIWRFHREGRLQVIYLAGATVGGRRGAKDGRVDRQEWARFKASLSVSIGVAAPVEAPAPATGGPGRPKKVATPAEPGSFLDRFERKAQSR